MPRSARISAGRRGTTWPAPLYGRIADAREAPAPTPDDGFAVLGRDGARVHLWQAADRSWSERDDLRERPVRSGAESFLAGTASCRIETDDVDGLYAELAAADVLHPVSHDGVTETDFGTREFATPTPTAT